MAIYELLPTNDWWYIDEENINSLDEMLALGILWLACEAAEMLYPDDDSWGNREKSLAFTTFYLFHYSKISPQLLEKGFSAVQKNMYSQGAPTDTINYFFKNTDRTTAQIAQCFINGDNQDLGQLPGIFYPDKNLKEYSEDHINSLISIRATLLMLEEEVADLVKSLPQTEVDTNKLIQDLLAEASRGLPISQLKEMEDFRMFVQILIDGGMSYEKLYLLSGVNTKVIKNSLGMDEHLNALPPTKESAYQILNPPPEAYKQIVKWNKKMRKTMKKSAKKAFR